MGTHESTARPPDVELSSAAQVADRARTSGRRGAGVNGRAVARRLAAVAAPALPVLLLIALWQLLVQAGVLTPARLFPPVGDSWDALLALLRGEAAVGSSYGHIAATLYRIAVAFVVSFLAGSLIGVLAGRQPIVYELLSNLLWILMAIPSVVWAFIFVVVVGTGDVVPIAALIALLTPKVIITVAEGTKAMPQDLLQMADSYRASRLQRATGLFIPYLVPYFVSSARESFSVAIKIAVVAETIGLSRGIGYELNHWYNLVFLAPIIAWGVVMIAFGVSVDYGVFAPLERHVSRWRRADVGLPAPTVLE